jgi:hypothetical protein
MRVPFTKLSPSHKLVAVGTFAFLVGVVPAAHADLGVSNVMPDPSAYPSVSGGIEAPLSSTSYGTGYLDWYAGPLGAVTGPMAVPGYSVTNRTAVGAVQTFVRDDALSLPVTTVRAGHLVGATDEGSDAAWVGPNSVWSDTNNSTEAHTALVGATVDTTGITNMNRQNQEALYSLLAGQF